MTTLLVAVLMHLSAGDDMASRVAVLGKHLERLSAITVTADCATEKAARLDELKRAFEGGIADQNAYNAFYLKMDDVRTWLLAHSVERPARAAGSFEEAGDQWLIKTDKLQVAVDKATGSMTVTTPKEVWKTASCAEGDLQYGDSKFSLNDARTKTAESFNTGYSIGMTLTFSDFPQQAEADLRFTINIIGSEVVVELAAPGDPAGLKYIRWPKPIVMEGKASEVSVIPHMQGMLVPGGWPQKIDAEDLVNSRSLYMPWWGQIRDGHGVQTILETSDDAGAEYHHVANGATTIQPRWYSSLGKLAYLRTVRYVFDDNATYVTMAKRYRREVQETGRFVSLDEKRLRTPGVNEVIGRPVVHLGSLYHFVQEAQLFNKEKIELNHNLTPFADLEASLRKLKEKGIDDAYVHLDGWGFYGYDNGHPDVLPVGEEQGGLEGLKRFAATCKELGYLFAVHDQYRDYYVNAVSYDERLTVRRADGTFHKESVWCGGPQTILSARFAPEYVRRNHDLFAAYGVPVEGAYLDVFSVVPLEESWDKAHPVTRSDCARYRKECFAILRARGYVVSSEEPTDYLASSLDLVHHGPYPTAPNLGGGDAKGIPVPLFNLVYHDSLLLPWDMGEDGGWGIPKGDAGRLHCFLNAGLPYVGPGADEKQIAFVKQAAALSQRCATKEMVNHEFLDEGRRKQRSTFADGTRVTVDFGSRECVVEPPL